MRALVTGGGGFVGGAIVDALLARGDSVRSLARGDYPALRDKGVETVRGDLCDPAAVLEACEGVDVVFHVAARVGYSGAPAEYERINIDGTQNVVNACREQGVQRLVYTSTPSVVHSRQGSEGLDETAPYPTRWIADYPRTKAAAETVVLGADDAGLRTVSIRPRGVWGPGDTQLFPRLVTWARQGQLKRIGTADPLQDFSYIDNVVQAHLRADEVLRTTPDAAGGNAYFITDGSPLGVWTMMEKTLACAGLGLPDKRVPLGVANVASVVIETLWRWLSLQSEPRLTRYKLDVLTKPCWFDISAARRDLGYAPEVSTEQGLANLKSWYEAGGLES